MRKVFALLIVVATTTLAVAQPIEINAYNAMDESIANEYGVLYFNITPIYRNGLENSDLVADDQLHPSGLQYTQYTQCVHIMVQQTTVTENVCGLTTLQR
jgi:hypothetical protein